MNRAHNFKDLTGMVFGRLTIIRIAPKKTWRDKRAEWECRCLCGNLHQAQGFKLRRKEVKSCGCLRREPTHNITHSFSRKTDKEKRKFYDRYYVIVKRCNDSNHKYFSNYGGRGIKCEWQTFEEFRDDMYQSYIEHVQKFGEKQTTIDRIDNEVGYNRNNCRWATWKEQGKNRRNSRHFD